MTFAALLRREPRPLAFGLAHTLAATIGQTFVIALFLPGIKQSFALSDAEVSLLFSATTLASAVILWRVGAWIDRTDVVRYSLACGVFLAFACAIIAVADRFALLVVGMFCLRLAGNGLLTHVALTATARYFTQERGRALSLVLLGSSIGEAGLPAPVVALAGACGWRWSLAAVGCFGLTLVFAAAATVWKEAAFRRRPSGPADLGHAPIRHGRARACMNSRTYFVLTAPLFIGMPVAITAAVFHQALIAEAKGVSLQWFAVSFIAFAVSRVFTSIFIGPAADRVGSHGLFCIHLLPLAFGTVCLIVIDAAAVVPLYWFCAGVTSGMGGVLQTTILAERVSPERLGAARSILGAATIVGSAIGPSLYGFGVAAGAHISTILWVSVAALMIATLLGFLSSSSARERA